MTGYHKRGNVLSDHRVGVAVCRVYDADLCGRIYECVGRCA